VTFHGFKDSIACGVQKFNCLNTARVDFWFTQGE
jgi:hypothetical protein